MISSQRPLHPSLQAKLQLLENIQKGNFQKVASLAYALSKVGRTNPELYGKLSMFVQQHKKQLNQADSSDEEVEPEIVNVDDDFVDGKEWDSDQSIEYSDDQQNEDQNQADKQNQKMVKSTVITSNDKKLFKEIRNNIEKRSTSKTKLTKVNSTYQFKTPIVVNPKKTNQNQTSSKAQLHRNSAIGKSKNVLAK